MRDTPSPGPGPTASLTPADAADVTDELVTTEHVPVTPDGELPSTAQTGRVVLWKDEVKDDVWQGREPAAQRGC